MGLKWISILEKYEHIADPKYWNVIDTSDEYFPNEFVGNLLHDMETMPSVVDIGRIKGKGWAIIGTNQAWASGIYGCDPSGVLKVLEKSCY